MIKYGVKLWSNNRRCFFEQAVELCAQGKIDFVELYVHPEMIDLANLKLFKKIKTTVHATHHEHGFDLIDFCPEKLKLFQQVVKIADYLASEKIIIHAGVGADNDGFKANFEKIYDPRLLVENLPKISLDGQIFFGYSLEQLSWIKKNVVPNFCFDFDHAVKSAFSRRLDYKVFIQDLIEELRPSYFHLYDGFSDSETDEHLDLGKGNFDLKWIKGILVDISREKEINLVFEVPKNENDLNNDLANINFFKSLAV